LAQPGDNPGAVAVTPRAAAAPAFSPPFCAARPAVL